jgi:hypothetical protein
MNLKESWQDSLDGGSAYLKAATYTRQGKHRKTQMNAASGTGTHDANVRVGWNIFMPKTGATVIGRIIPLLIKLFNYPSDTKLYDLRVHKYV